MHPILTFPNYVLTFDNTLWHAFCSVPHLPFFNTVKLSQKRCFTWNGCKWMFHVEQTVIDVSRETKC